MKNNSESIRTINYKITAEIHKLKINKNFNYQTKILWKRHQNKAQTKLVTHAHGFSIFNQRLTLQLALQYDQTKNAFLEKNTELIPVISTETGIKSGGYSKFDITQGLSLISNKINKTIPLTKCPDPEAYIQLTFYFEQIGEGFSQQLSNLNASSRDLNMSKIQWSEDNRLSELKNIENTIQKLDQLANRVTNKKSQNLIPEYKKRIEILEGQNKQLKKSISNFEQRLQKNETNWKNQKKELERQITNLEKQLDKKSKQITQKVRQINNLNENIRSKTKLDDSSTEDDKSKNKYIELYKNTKENLQSKEQIIKNLEKQIQILKATKVSKKINNDLTIEEQNKIQILERDKIQLQNQLASSSHKLAELFNVAYQIGGAQLLDKLQGAIGLIQ